METIEISCIYLAISFLLRKKVSPVTSDQEKLHIAKAQALSANDGCDEPASNTEFDYNEFIQNKKKWWLSLGVSDEQIASILVSR